MAIREIRKFKDEALRKVCKPVEKFDQRLITLLEDMVETMYKANGVGLAAPQIGILKRVVVIDIGDGVIELINPKIIKTSGSYVDTEGCLSLPGITDEVERPYEVTVEALDRYGNKIELTGKELMARAICHELDHLDGVLFTDRTKSNKEA
jgi:peptide deformylase